MKHGFFAAALLVTAFATGARAGEVDREIDNYLGPKVAPMGHIDGPVVMTETGIKLSDEAEAAHQENLSDCKLKVKAIGAPTDLTDVEQAVTSMGFSLVKKALDDAVKGDKTPLAEQLRNSIDLCMQTEAMQNHMYIVFRGL